MREDTDFDDDLLDEEGEGTGGPDEDAIPESFAKDLATRMVVLFEKEVDPKAAAVTVSDFVYTSTNTLKKLPYFIDALEMLLDNEQTQRLLLSVGWRLLMKVSTPRTTLATYRTCSTTCWSLSTTWRSQT